MAAAALLALVLALLAAQPEAPPPAPADQPRPGLSYRRLQLFADSVVHVVGVDLDRTDLGLRVSPPDQRGLAPEAFAGAETAPVTVNASFFDTRYAPVGHTVSDGQTWPDAYATDSAAVFACDAAKRCAVQAPPVTPRADWRLALGALPALLIGGEDQTAAGCRDREKFCLSPHPRTALGLSGDGRRLWIVVAEGRRPPVLGLSIGQLVEVFRQLGATEAANLDGGGSSALLLGGRPLAARPFNEPASRPVANVLQVIEASGATLSERRAPD